MSRHRHDGGRLVRRTVDYEYVAHHDADQPGLLVVTGVPADVCELCDEHWFPEEDGFELTRLLGEHEPGPGQIHTIDWLGSRAA
jgi:hypothetical protein